MALVGLLGILIGEQVVPIVKRFVSGERVSVGWVKRECVPHVFGELPTKSTARIAADQEVQP